MAESYASAVPPEREGRYLPEIERLTVSQLGDALIAAHDSGLHSDAVGTPFRYAAWDDPDVIGRHYKLE